MKTIMIGLGFSNLVLRISIALLTFGSTVARAADAVPPMPPVSSSSNVSLRNEVQLAVDKGLAWLTKTQDTNGFWSTADHPAITALGLAAFRGNSRAGQRGEDPPAVKKGYAFLVSCAQPDGGIYRKDLPSYNTSIALMALALDNRPEFQPLIANARKFIIGLQTGPEQTGNTNDPYAGGIGYGKQDKHPDLSNTSWALEALYFSRRARDEKTPRAESDLNWQAAVHFIQSCQNLRSHNSQDWASDDPADKGGFIYAPGRSMAGQTNLPSGKVALRSYGSMSYAGLLSYIYADVKRDDPRVTAVMDWLRANYTLDENPAMGPQGLYYYYHTMTKALTQYGESTLITREGKKVVWREELALRLINLQRAEGSWANDNGRWLEKDPVLVTAYSLIALEMIRNNL